MKYLYMHNKGINKSKFFKSKKGMDIDLWFNIFELIVVFLVSFVLLDFVNGEASGITFEKNYFARDSALLINTIYSSPGDIQYFYPEKTNELVFDFNKNKISVYEPREVIEGGAVDYIFAEDKNYELNYKVIQPKQGAELTYTKRSNNLEIN